MLSYIKLCLRISSNAFDVEIQALIDDCLAELAMLNIYHEEMHKRTVDGATVYDAQIQSCVMFYVKQRFGNRENAEQWEKIYNDKVTKLMVASGYGLEVI